MSKEGVSTRMKRPVGSFSANPSSSSSSSSSGGSACASSASTGSIRRARDCCFPRREEEGGARWDLFIRAGSSVGGGAAAVSKSTSNPPCPYPSGGPGRKIRGCQSNRVMGPSIHNRAGASKKNMMKRSEAVWSVSVNLIISRNSPSKAWYEQDQKNQRMIRKKNKTMPAHFSVSDIFHASRWNLLIKQCSWRAFYINTTRNGSYWKSWAEYTQRT